MNLATRTIKAVDTHATALLDELGISSIIDFDPTSMSADERKAARRLVDKSARALIDKITDKTSEAKAETIERAFDGLRMAIDAIDNASNSAAQEYRSERRPFHGGSARGVDDGSGSRDEPEVVRVGLTREQRVADWYRREVEPHSEYAGLGLGQYFRAMTIGAKSDLEKRALSEGTDSAGGFTVPDILSARLIDLLRAQSVLTAAGAMTLPLTSDRNSIAKLATDPAPAWRSENAEVAESDPTFGSVVLTPRSLAVMVKVSRELLEDSLNIETELPRVMAAALAKEWDRVGLEGTGSAPEPRGILNTSSIGENALDGPLLGYDQLVVARTSIKTANAEPTAVILHPRDEGALVGFKDGAGQPLMAPRAIEAIQMLTTSSIATDGGSGTNESTIYMGDFRHLYLGLRSVIRVDVLRELFAGNHQYGFVCHMRGDIAVAHPGAFHVTSGVQPPA